MINSFQIPSSTLEKQWRHLFDVVGQRPHLQLQVPAGELRLLPLLHLQLLKLLRPPQLVFARVVHHGGVAAVLLLLLQLESESLKQKTQVKEEEEEVEQQ